MKIVGFDPGIEKTGFAVFEGEKREFKYLDSGLIFTPKSDKLEVRLKIIYQKVRKLINRYKPDLFVIEKLFYFKNQKTVIHVSQAQGVLLLLASLNDIKVKFLTPLQIKQTLTGYGRADKKSVQKMLKLTLDLDDEIKIDDVADAVASCVAYFYLS